MTVGTGRFIAIMCRWALPGQPAEGLRPHHVSAIHHHPACSQIAVQQPMRHAAGTMWPVRPPECMGWASSSHAAPGGP